MLEVLLAVGSRVRYLNASPGGKSDEVDQGETSKVASRVLASVRELAGAVVDSV